MRLSLGRKSAVVVDVISIYVLADDILIAIYHFTYQKKKFSQKFPDIQTTLTHSYWLVVGICAFSFQSNQLEILIKKMCESDVVEEEGEERRRRRLSIKFNSI